MTDPQKPRPRRALLHPGKFPLQYAELTQNVILERKVGKIACPTPADMHRVANEFWNWRKSLENGLQQKTYSSQAEQRTWQTLLQQANRIAVQKSEETLIVRFVPREETTAAKLLETIEYED